MEKKIQDIIIEDKNISKNEIDNFKTKTTNVNILLNRVRLNKKKDFKKKIFVFFILLLVLSLITSFALI